MIEEWKFFKENKLGIYEVSNLGRCKLNGKIFIPNDSVTYLKFGAKHIHRIVAELFIPNDDANRTYVDHIDGDTHNNCVTNLRWCSNKENMNFPLAKQHVLESHLKFRKQKTEKVYKGHSHYWKGKISPFKGHKHSEESKNKQRESALNRKVKYAHWYINPDTNKRVYYN